MVGDGARMTEAGKVLAQNQRALGELKVPKFVVVEQE